MCVGYDRNCYVGLSAKLNSKAGDIWSCSQTTCTFHSTWKHLNKRRSIFFFLTETELHAAHWIRRKKEKCLLNFRSKSYKEYRSQPTTLHGAECAHAAWGLIRMQAAGLWLFHSILIISASTQTFRSLVRLQLIASDVHSRDRCSARIKARRLAHQWWMGMCCEDWNCKLILIESLQEQTRQCTICNAEKFKETKPKPHSMACLLFNFKKFPLKLKVPRLNALFYQWNKKLWSSLQYYARIFSLFHESFSLISDKGKLFRCIGIFIVFLFVEQIFCTCLVPWEYSST